MSFKLTYATMFDPPAELHERFDQALAAVQADLGREHGHFIAGRDVHNGSVLTARTPADTRIVTGHFAGGGPAEVARAVQAAHTAYPGWRTTAVADRIAVLRRAARLIEERVYRIGVAVALEVGKNRMEALGEVQETAEFFNVYCDDFEAHDAYRHTLPDDPLPGWHAHNASVMRPYGVWAVITPFNFPFALAGGPTAAALVTGNTVVLKGATDTPWSGRLLAECLRDAGLPDGVFNYVCGGADAGEALVRHAHVAGITFTGSHAVGMGMLRTVMAGALPRPCIAEMGGKNACIVTAQADLERAAAGILRSAFGMSGQKCSALSRLCVDARVADELLARLQAGAAAIRTGDPLRRENWMGPVIDARATQRFDAAMAQVAGSGRIACGGARLRGGEHEHGHFVEPTIIEFDADHELWQRELFLPVLAVRRTPDNATAMALANVGDFGLTAGIYGAADEVAWFHEHIEAGVTYANRPQGATTGAWPGYQPFGGWKGSGSTGKAIASFYYLAQYLREQSRTVVA